MSLSWRNYKWIVNKQAEKVDGASPRASHLGLGTQVLGDLVKNADPDSLELDLGFYSNSSWVMSDSNSGTRDLTDMDTDDQKQFHSYRKFQIQK